MLSASRASSKRRTSWQEASPASAQLQDKAQGLLAAMKGRRLSKGSTVRPPSMGKNLSMNDSTSSASLSILLASKDASLIVSQGDGNVDTPSKTNRTMDSRDDESVDSVGSLFDGYMSSRKSNATSVKGTVEVNESDLGVATKLFPTESTTEMDDDRLAQELRNFEEDDSLSLLSMLSGRSRTGRKSAETQKEAIDNSSQKGTPVETSKGSPEKASPPLPESVAFEYVDEATDSLAFQSPNLSKGKSPRSKTSLLSQPAGRVIAVAMSERTRWRKVRAPWKHDAG